MIPNIIIIINSFDISTNSFGGLSGDPASEPETFTGTIEEDCTGSISGNTFGSNVLFSFDSENGQLDIDGVGIFSVDAFPWIL